MVCSISLTTGMITSDPVFLFHHNRSIILLVIKGRSQDMIRFQSCFDCCSAVWSPIIGAWILCLSCINGTLYFDGLYFPTNCWVSNSLQEYNMRFRTVSLPILAFHFGEPKRRLCPPISIYAAASIIVEFRCDEKVARL